MMGGHFVPLSLPKGEKETDMLTGIIYKDGKCRVGIDLCEEATEGKSACHQCGSRDTFYVYDSQKTRLVCHDCSAAVEEPRMRAPNGTIVPAPAPHKTHPGFPKT
jgi:hypothetical protein